ncbi:abortive infection protein, putative [unidentified eubacterium SCB49]|nr:abortive infection protein, putative [unidentified eubacterium SCB49]
MLVKFTAGNYLSFKEKVSIDLNATSLTEYRSDNIFSTSVSNIDLLKSMVAYGSNSSGKSNLFKAIKFVKRFIQNSSKNSQANEKINTEHFRLSLETIDKPSFFEIEIVYDSAKYRYGFEVDVEKVHKEWLFFSKKTKEYPLFERDNQSIEIGSKFNSASGNLISNTRDNALFLSVCAQFNIEIAINLIKELSNINYISGTNDRDTIDFTIKLLNDSKYHRLVNNFIKGAKLGFNKIETEKIEITEEMLNKSGIPKDLHKMVLENNTKETLITTEHIVYDKDKEPQGNTYFDLLKNESLGTRKIFSLAGPIIDAIINGRTLIIDEFDARLHPLLAKAIIKLFNSNENPKAQLIIASHNSHFINSSSKLFRRDQIIIVEKDFYGQTKMETLNDKKIRKDASFEKDYLSGKYDGIPIKLEINSQLNLFE